MEPITSRKVFDVQIQLRETTGADSHQQGNHSMKKIILTVATATSLIALGACARSPEGAAIENSGEMMADNMEMKADNMDAMADSTSNAMASDMMENSADAMNAKADDVRDTADNAADTADAMAANKQ